MIKSEQTNFSLHADSFRHVLGALVIGIFVAAASVAEEVSSKDTETRTFEIELRQFELQENVIASFVLAFDISSPEIREKLWQQLEKDKADAAARQEEQDASSPVAPLPPGGYDAETLRYKSVVEALNLPSGMAEDLVEMFAANEAGFRKVLWDRVVESTIARK